MSYQYPQSQYPTYPQPPQWPPTSGGAPGSGSIDLPAAPEGSTPGYEPVPADMGPAEMHSRELSALAAGKGPIQYAIKVPDGPPADYPMLMYKKEDRTTKPAKDEKEKADLTGKGYSDQPFPPEDPNTLTTEMLQSLQQVWSKAGDSLKTLINLVQQQQQQMQAAGAILGAGQPPQYPTGGQQQDPNLFQQQQYPPPGYPTGD